MTFECSLTIHDRVKESYGSIVSSSLSILGAIGTLLLISYNNRQKRLKTQTLDIQGGCGSESSLLQYSLQYPTIPATLMPQAPSFTSSPQKENKLTKYIVHLASSELLASLFVLTSRIMLIKFDSDFIDSPDNRSTAPNFSYCTISSGLVGFGYLSSIMWTSTLGFHIFRLFTTNLKNSSKKISYIYYLVCWGLPLAGGISLMASANVTQLNGVSWCYVNNYVLLGLFYIPMIISIIASIYFTYRIKSRFKKLSLSLSRTNLKNIKSKVVLRLNLFTIVFIICWTMSIINFATKLIGNCSNPYIDIIALTLSPAQGLLNFLSFAYSNRKSIAGLSSSISSSTLNWLPSLSKSQSNSKTSTPTKPFPPSPFIN